MTFREAIRVIQGQQRDGAYRNRLGDEVADSIINQLLGALASASSPGSRALVRLLRRTHLATREDHERMVEQALDAARAEGRREGETLSAWQWARIGALVKHARVLLDDEAWATFIGRVDEDQFGGAASDPRAPAADVARPAERGTADG